MARPAGLERNAELARAVLAARSARTPWKVLERLYGLSRVHLWSIAKAYEERVNLTKNRISLTSFHLPARDSA